MVGIIICSSIFFIEIILLTILVIISNKVHKQDLEEWPNRGEPK